MDDDPTIEHSRSLTTLRRRDEPEGGAEDPEQIASLLNEFETDLEQRDQDSGLDDQDLEVADLLNRAF
jgi:hypothetical protein